MQHLVGMSGDSDCEVHFGVSHQQQVELKVLAAWKWDRLDVCSTLLVAPPTELHHTCAHVGWIRVVLTLIVPNASAGSTEFDGLLFVPRVVQVRLTSSLPSQTYDLANIPNTE